MGRDKLRRRYRGRALAEWIAHAVEAAAGTATLVGNAELGGIPDLCPGLPEPLCAVHHKRAAGAIETKFAVGIRKVTTALHGLATAWFPATDGQALENVNTPEDWAGYAAE
jgi:molybdopterin-guanine dinucleotide biosynthesis protein A